jgi:Ca2+-binding EF-hand superfamily protein
LKRDLQFGSDYSAAATFKTIDRPESGSITSANLGEFFKKLGHFASEAELLAIIRRIDTDGDA